MKAIEEKRKLEKEVMRLIKRLRYLKRKHNLKSGFYFEHGSILNTYREGDVTFKQAVRYLKEVEKEEVKRAQEKLLDYISSTITSYYLNLVLKGRIK